MNEFRQMVENHISNLSGSKHVLDYQLNQLNQDISSYLKYKKDTFHTVEVMGMVSIILQDLIDTISTQNIRKIESLVNSALTSIFWDMDLALKIEQGVKRNVNIYKFTLLKNGNRGTINSNGGGIWSVVAAIIKILCNILLEKYPFLIFDEGLSGVSDKYVPSTIKFIKGLSKSLAVDVCVITHKRSFIENSPTVYSIDFASEEDIIFAKDSKKISQEPYIKVEKITRLERNEEDEEITF